MPILPPKSPVEPAECRREAQAALAASGPEATARATAWALLALAGELATIRRLLQKGGR